MAAPTIPASSTQAVQTTGGGTTPFTMSWYNFFAALVNGPLGPTPLVGVTDGSNAAAGIVGEYKSTIVPFGSGITLTNNVTAQIASLALTAGDWDLDGEFYVTSAATKTFTDWAAYISNDNSGTLPGTNAPGDGFDYAGSPVTSASVGGTSAEPYTLNGLHTRINITTPTTYYLMAFAAFSGTGTVTGYGALRARRMR